MYIVRRLLYAIFGAALTAYLQQHEALPVPRSVSQTARRVPNEPVPELQASSRAGGVRLVRSP